MLPGAAPSTVPVGGSSLLTVMVTPNSGSTGIAVACNTSSIGGTGLTLMYDDGTHGDVTPNDLTFSLLVTIAAGTPPGPKSIFCVANDTQSETGFTTISLDVVPAQSTPPGGLANLTPLFLSAGGIYVLTVIVTPGTNPASTGLSVACDLTPLGGSPSQSLADQGANAFSFQGTVATATSPGPKSGSCMITDDQSRSGTVLWSTMVQQNLPPTVSAGGPYSVDEGGSVLLTATGQDPEGSPLTFAWDLDNNGTFETPGQTVTFLAGDGPATQTVRVRVTDIGGLTATAEATVRVMNIPPTATFTAPTSAQAGFPFALSLSDPQDPSSADTAAGFTYAFDCGGGYGAFGSSATASCVATDVGMLSVGGKIRDKDGGVTEYRATVEVIVTFDGLCELTHSYSTKPQIADSLCAKLRNAAAAPNANALDGLLDAFQNQVDAQTNKAFTPAQAAVLKRLADRLRP
jgi:hypothetical protein